MQRSPMRVASLLTLGGMLLLAASMPMLAASAIATLAGDVPRTLGVAHNHATQEQADAEAIGYCAQAARDNGVGHLATQCAVVERPSRPGFAAVVCGDNGCASGYADTTVDAVQAALENCRSTNAGQVANCRPEGSYVWQELAAANARTAIVAPAGGWAIAEEPDLEGRMLADFYNRTYRHWDARLKCWVSVEPLHGVTQRYCWRGLLSISQPVGADGAPRSVHVVAGGQAIDEQGNPMSANADVGAVGVFHAVHQDGKFVARSGTRFATMGQMGAPPEEWQPREIGANLLALHALTGYFGMGITSTRDVLFVAHGSAMQDVGFYTYYSNAGSCSEPACVVELKIEYEIDRSQPGTPLYPLRLMIKERRGVAPTCTRTATAKFDAATWRYVLPNDLVVRELQKGV